MNDHTKAIVAHITIIGWLIALITNQPPNQTPLTSFYLRQTLGLVLVGLIAGFIPLVGAIVALIMFIGWIISLVGAIQNKEMLLPGVGTYFQDWFKSI